MNYNELKKYELDFWRNASRDYRNVSKYEGYVDISHIPLLEKKVEISVRDIDCLDAVREMENGVVLNLASDVHPGGGWGRTIAQEESIFYRSSAHLSLRRDLYPLQGAVLYTPKLGVNKLSDYTTQVPIWNTSMITCAGIRNPKLLSNGMMNKSDYNELVARIHRILCVAVLNDHRSIVLGAIGCGAFHCPIYDVVHAFKHVLSKYEYRFEKIVFAVREDRRKTFETFNREWNYQKLN